MPLYFTSTKDRLGFTTKCNHPKFSGAKKEFPNWIYHVSEHSTASGWTGPNSLLTFSHPVTGADITLYTDPSNISQAMLQQAATDRRTAVENAQAALDS